MTSEELSMLREDPRSGVRLMVAGHGKTPPWTLELLSSDPDRHVRHAAAVNLLNNDTPGALLAGLAVTKDPDLWGRANLARSLATEPATYNRDAALTLLAADPSPLVRAAVAEVSDLPPAAKKTLAQQAPIPAIVKKKVGLGAIYGIEIADIAAVDALPTPPPSAG